MAVWLLLNSNTYFIGSAHCRQHQLTNNTRNHLDWSKFCLSRLIGETVQWLECPISWIAWSGHISTDIDISHSNPQTNLMFGTTQIPFELSEPLDCSIVWYLHCRFVFVIIQLWVFLWLCNLCWSEIQVDVWEIRAVAHGYAAMPKSAYLLCMQWN